MNSTTRIERRRIETRDDLVRAASAVFAERGFHAASLQQVAQRAGFTTGAIYGHFRSKDELFLAVFEQYALLRVAELSAIEGAPEGAFGARARAMADQWMARHTENPGFTIVVLEFAVHALRAPQLREALAGRYAAVRLAAARMLEEDARAAGVELPLPALDLATALRELGVGLSLAQLLDPGAVRESLYGDFVEHFYRLMEQPTAAARHEGGGAS